MASEELEEGRYSLNNHSAASEEISKYFTGTHEVQECIEGQGEVDLHTHLANCKKNPGHKNFVPVNELTIEHFPPSFHDDFLLGLTKVVADLTVRIAVQFTSLGRPEFLPGTSDPYPCYKNRGKNSMRTGTGKVWQVIKHTQERKDRTCPCPECVNSDTPSKVWWGVHVQTAKHVVYDSSEMIQSSCRLWFDDDTSPVVNIYGWKMEDGVTAWDLSLLTYVTHDLEVGDKLGLMKRWQVALWRKVNDKYTIHRDVHKLTIIVSHPHGCCKHVSVGHWVHRQEVEDNWTRYTYTTCTCPGSSGALVYRVGCFVSEHPHSGVNSDGLNYSGVWTD